MSVDGPISAPLQLPDEVQDHRRTGRKRAVPKFWAIRGTLTRSQYITLAICGVATPILIWLALAASGLLPAVFMPGPVRVAARFGEWVAREGFTNDLAISIQRVTLGFLASLAIALPLGLLAGTFRPIQVFTEPAMDFIRYMPAVAFVPLVMLWCGLGEASKIAIIFIGTFFQLILMIADDVRKVPMPQIEAAQTMGASRREIIAKVIFPSAAPALLTTCRVTLGWAWTYLVVAEIVAANTGLGYSILKAQRFLQTDKIFAGLIVIGLIGLVQDQALRGLAYILFPYQRGR